VPRSLAALVRELKLLNGTRIGSGCAWPVRRRFRKSVFACANRIPGDPARDGRIQEGAMSLRRSARAVVAFGACALTASCQQPPPQNAAQLAALHAAGTCDANLPVFGWFSGGGRFMQWYLAPHGSIIMDNDGGWCSIRYDAYYGTVPITPEMRVVEPPQHGDVVVGSLAKVLRIAYRPTPGYVGQDAFKVHISGPTPDNIPVNVVVTR